MIRFFVCAVMLALAACKPPALDDYVERTRLPERRDRPSIPLASPQTDNAIWARTSERLLYGNPGESPLFALECKSGEPPAAITFTRYAQADPHAKAVLALIGNGHVKRLMIDSARTGDVWIWQGTLSATDPAWDVLTGAREVEATIPGAGTLKLNPSVLPGELIERCRSMLSPAMPAVAE